jgi:hypothetical protein
MLTKSDLLSFRQCARKLWLERHRKDLLPKPNSTTDRRIIDGAKVGEKARDELGGALRLDTHSDPVEGAKSAKNELIGAPGKPGVEVPMLRDDLYVRADALVPLAEGYALRETKASTFPLKADKVTPDEPKAHYLEDVAIQAWTMDGSGLPLMQVELNLLDNRWLYPGNGNYVGLFRQLDVTADVAKMKSQVPQWLEGARKTLASDMPELSTGKHCTVPYACPFIQFCRDREPAPPEHPIELLPDSAGKKLAQKLKAEYGYTSILQPSPDELTGKGAEIYRRVQRAHREGKPILDERVRDTIESLSYPRYYLDFEGIDLPVPLWAGIRPYEQVIFQWSCHIQSAPDVFAHTEFLDLSGADPSLACIAALQASIDPAGDTPIVVYNATYERGRLEGLAKRHPEHSDLMNGYVSRLFDLLPVVKGHFYDPRMRGSFSIKKVLPAIAEDLRYEELEEVQEGTGAQVAYMQSVFERLDAVRLNQISNRLRKYCRQDTWAMVEIAVFLSGRPRPTRPLEGSSVEMSPTR